RARMVGGSLQAGDDATDARVFPQDSLPEYIPFRTHRDVIARWLTAQSPPGEAVSPGVQIRPSRQADRDSIIDLLQAIPANRDINAEELQAVRHRLRQKLGYEVLVAELANAVVGYLVLSFVPALSGLRAWIDDIAVNPAFQRQGVGASLVEAAMRLADQRGATHIFVYAGRANVAAREFYRACGFDEEGVARVRIR
ncbi:MAG: GNAT family N-acetyltransferase, partial [Chloroflexota bacterium]